jgi:hypothetical protein
MGFIMEAKTVATVLAANRLLIGAGMATAPGTATRMWIGPHADNDGARLMARAAGARDVGLALGGGVRRLARRRLGDRASVVAARARLVEVDYAEEQQQDHRHDRRHQQGAAASEPVREEEEQGSRSTRLGSAATPAVG